MPVVMPLSHADMMCGKTVVVAVDVNDVDADVVTEVDTDVDTDVDNVVGVVVADVEPVVDAEVVADVVGVVYEQEPKRPSR